MSFIKNRPVLERGDLHRIALDIIEYGLESADPYRAVVASLRISDNIIYVRDTMVKVRGRIHVIGFGKASRRMADAMYNVLGNRIAGGIVISPEGSG
ncbi:MAG: DUF4147 domain-containing protein, partial [Ignisphaera sp.]